MLICARGYIKRDLLSGSALNPRAELRLPRTPFPLGGSAVFGGFVTRMLGRMRPSWCPVCRAPSGIDCPDTSKSSKEQRQREARAWRSAVDSVMNEEDDDFVGLMMPITTRCATEGCKNRADEQSKYCVACDQELPLSGTTLL